MCQEPLSNTLSPGVGIQVNADLGGVVVRRAGNKGLETDPADDVVGLDLHYPDGALAGDVPEEPYPILPTARLKIIRPAI